MQVGIIGAGTLARAFAQKAINAGHTVVFSSSRGPQALTETVAQFGSKATAATTDAAARMPIVLLAVPWPRVETVLRELPAWNGRILIDPTNAFRDGTPSSGIVPFDDGSSSELVASLATGARVVKAMNSMYMSNFAKEPAEGRFRRAIFISGDDSDARTSVADLFESLGLAPIELGSLAVGGRIQQAGGPMAAHDFFVPWPAARSF